MSKSFIIDVWQGSVYTSADNATSSQSNMAIDSATHKTHAVHLT